jgi:hypothetical protein
MKITWQKAKDFIYLGTILFMIIFYFRDEAKEKATMEVTLQEVREDVLEIKSAQNVKFRTYDQYWIQNTENITRIVTVLELDAD